MVSNRSQKEFCGKSFAERVLRKEKEKGNIDSVNYGITISSKDDCGMRLVTTTPAPTSGTLPAPPPSTTERVAAEPSPPALVRQVQV